VKIFSPERPKSRRGRPRALSFSPEEIADRLSMPAAAVVRVLERGPSPFFPGARKVDGAWRVPECDVRRLFGEEPRLYSVADFAELVGLSVPWVYQLMQTPRDDDPSRMVIPHRRVLGQKRIPATAYWELPADRPASLAPRPSSFSRNG